MYASTYFRHARAYIETTPYRIEEEVMAVLIQRLGDFESAGTGGHGLNDANEVVGVSGSGLETTALLFRDGHVIALPDVGGGYNWAEDINNVGLMEDRATLRISSLHICNWLLHGIASNFVEMRETGEMNWCCSGGGGVSANERADELAVRAVENRASTGWVDR